MEWFNYKNVRFFLITFIIIDIIAYFKFVELIKFLIGFELVVLIPISLFTLKRIVISKGIIKVKYILLNKEYIFSENYHLQFYYKEGSKANAITLKLINDAENNVFGFKKKIVLKDLINRKECEEIFHFLKQNQFKVILKGDFYWLR